MKCSAWCFPLDVDTRCEINTSILMKRDDSTECKDAEDPKEAYYDSHEWLRSKKSCINPVPRDQRKSRDQASSVQNQITTVVNNVRQNQGSAILTFRTTLIALPGIHLPSNRQRIQRILSDTIPEFCDFPDWTKPIVYSEYEVNNALTA
jgi:hypothetical protein